jgi:hypothetical protein
VQLRRILWVASALLLVPAACVRSGASAEDEIAPDDREPIRLEVLNHNWSDVTVFVLREGSRDRVGVATAATTTVLSIPRHLLGQLRVVQLIADPIGSSNGITSEAILLKPGMQVTWRLESDLRRSSVMVY